MKGVLQPSAALYRRALRESLGHKRKKRKREGVYYVSSLCLLDCRQFRKWWERERGNEAVKEGEVSRARKPLLIVLRLGFIVLPGLPLLWMKRVDEIGWDSALAALLVYCSLPSGLKVLLLHWTPGLPCVHLSTYFSSRGAYANPSREASQTLFWPQITFWICRVIPPMILSSTHPVTHHTTRLSSSWWMECFSGVVWTDRHHLHSKACLDVSVSAWLDPHSQFLGWRGFDWNRSEDRTELALIGWTIALFGLHIGVSFLDACQKLWGKKNKKTWDWSWQSRKRRV